MSRREFHKKKYDEFVEKQENHRGRKFAASRRKMRNPSHGRSKAFKLNIEMMNADRKSRESLSRIQQSRAETSSSNLSCLETKGSCPEETSAKKNEEQSSVVRDILLC